MRGSANPASTTAEVSRLARSMAEGRHLRAARPTGRPGAGLDPVFESLATALDGIFAWLEQEADAGLRYPALSEWLLDNEHLLREQLLRLPDDLPPEFHHELPVLTSGAGQGQPRAQRLAVRLVQGVTGGLDAEIIRDFLQAYQRWTPLTTGELWALAPLLRAAVLARITAAAAGAAGIDVSAKARPVLPPESPERAGAAAGDRLEMVSTGIETLRALDALSWEEVFEEVSLVDAVLRRDPAGAYARMDFETRDRYRKVVEDLARRGDRDELEVAEIVLRSARESDRDTPARHVGYHLVDAGRGDLEVRLDAAPGWRVRARRWIRRRGGALYVSSAWLGAAVLEVVLLGYLASMDAGAGASILVGLLGVVPALTLAVAVVNWTVTHALPPDVLPKMDFSEGLPEEARTAVAVPVLVADGEDVRRLLDDVEVLYAANRDPRFTFVLLTDLADAEAERDPSDEVLVDALRHGVRDLNRRHGPDGESGPFVLLHRHRAWNPSEGVWMGWERKRGKLHQLNRLVLSGETEAFPVTEGDPGRLAEVRYVVTLDADTRVPPGHAAALVGTLHHPLNQPVFGEGRRVERGYTVLQPRLETTPSTGRPTPFARLLEGERGIDLYTHAVSDVYQDLTGEGIYAGKGVYDVAAFERSLAGIVPENTLLSHDLFEGLHGRAGLVSDIEVYEDYPPHVLAYFRRSHRWIRGDWQLLPWLAPRVPSAGGGRVPNQLSLLDRWKMADNLRRSLMPPCLLGLALVGWALSLGSPWVWTATVLAVPAVPLFLGAATGTTRRFFERRRSEPRRLEGEWSGGLGRTFRWLAVEMARLTVRTAWLPHEAVVTMDAVGRTLWRLFVGRRRLLEWTSAAQAGRAARGTDALALWREMAVAPSVGAGVLVAAAATAPAVLTAVAPLAALWVAWPQLAWALSRRPRTSAAPLEPEDRRLLRALALRTWMYFERHVTSEEHWLPPDNVQERNGEQVVARRTSPTNIGMMLSAAQSAWDLGYLGSTAMEAVVRNTLESVESLERYRGHLLNWYSTRDRSPLAPRYVSTVDSGNLAAALLSLARGLEDVSGGQPLRPAHATALRDVVALLDDALVAVEREAPGQAVEGVREAGASLSACVVEAPEGLGDLVRCLGELETVGLDRLEEAVVDLVEGTSELRPATVRELRMVLRRVRKHVTHLRREVDTLVPWAPVLAGEPGGGDPSGEGRAVGSETIDRMRSRLLGPVALRRLPDLCAWAVERVDELRGGAVGPAEAAWLDELEGALEEGARAAGRLVGRLRDLRDRCDRLADAMDFTFLYDRRRKLFHIGYDVTSGELDPHHYDLLASEARIASFLAIARGQVPVEHWLQLARPFGSRGGSPFLLSWGGTMFEYLLPHLYLLSSEEALLERSSRVAVERQIAWGRRWGVPWGVSESAFAPSASNAEGYGYRAFGVPGLGLNRSVAERLVIAPYASMLALPLAAEAVVENARRLIREGMLGPLGFYEALDYGPLEGRRPRSPRIVSSYMAHHQGMVLVALAGVLSGRSQAERLHREPEVRSVEYLLHEAVPWQVRTTRLREHQRPGTRRLPSVGPVTSWQLDPAGDHPEVHVVADGEFRAYLTAAGAGGLELGNRVLVPWRSDPTVEASGVRLYVQDAESGRYFSATREPVPGDPELLETFFTPDGVEYHRREAGLTVRTRVGLADGEAMEVRHVTVRNDGSRARSLRLISYGEVALADAGGFGRHPAFHKLFVEAEARPGSRQLLFRRRRRAADDPPLHLGHAWVGPGSSGAARWTVRREAFLGRGGTPRSPAWLDGRISEPGLDEGSPLDPAFVWDVPIELAAGESRSVAFLTSAGSERDVVAARLAGVETPERAERILDAGRRRREDGLREHGLDAEGARRAQQLLSLAFHPREGIRADAGTRRRSRYSQADLWKHGISGDVPVVLVHVRGEDGIGPAGRMIRIHRWWRDLGVDTDLVLLDMESTGYARPLRDRLEAAIGRASEDDRLDRPGGIHLLGGVGMEPEERAGLEAASALVLEADEADVLRRLEAAAEARASLPRFVPVPSAPPTDTASAPLSSPSDLRFDNGWGGFSQDGREYVIRVDPERPTPAPWTNVVSNPRFGFLATERGLGSTWSEHAGENRLTPWRNDPVTDEPSEAVYVRDEETGEFWSATPSPRPADGIYEVRHGTGRTVYRSRAQGLEQRLSVGCPPDAPVKILELELTDLRERSRRVTVTCYAEWVLGSRRSATASHLVTGWDAGTRSLTVRNPFSPEHGSRTAFLTSSLPPHGVTTDRTEFLGRGGRLSAPAALERVGLSGYVEPADDPCAAYQVHVDLPAGGSSTIHFILGQGADRDEAGKLASRYGDPSVAGAALEAGVAAWEDRFGTIRVETPDRSLDLLVNRWLPYQTISSRLWGRTALYQSSGAYGFRDQLQDVASLFETAPGLARDHLVRAAGRQFREGDVLHWWQPGTTRGVRTRCSDDLLWLPWAAAAYVEWTGDASVLDEETPFLGGPELEPGEAERYAEWELSSDSGSLYEHASRALERARTEGPHGLPLIGSGDWNDGMDRVGREGRGESVWLAWFLGTVERSWADVAERRGDLGRARELREHAGELAGRVEEVGWDGEWYLRAFWDDGAPLGSSADDEARIDAISQAWAVLSGLGREDRVRTAMEAVEEQLVVDDPDLVLLLAPPFRRSRRDPGYIAGYPPGVRENGGQYSHAGAWVGLAWTRLGEGARAHEVFRRLDPVRRSAAADDVRLYRVEPYVTAADVYGTPPHAGRGGWTWYTGSGAWTRRLAVEGILGLRRRGDRLHVDPCLPPEWPGALVRWRHGDALYTIELRNPEGAGRGVARIELDGAELEEPEIPLLARGDHRVRVWLGPGNARPSAEPERATGSGSGD